MNILIPHNWLMEHLDTKATPKQIQEYLSLCGPSVERIYDREGEQVYDIEVTTNRVDSFSVRGIAREAAVILKQFGIHAELKPLKLDSELSIKNKNASLPLPQIHNDPKLNKRVLCVVLANLEHTPTPDWMAKRLKQIEVNVHDSMIDITNYVTHDLGHPCHAFDYDKIVKTGGQIIIEEAKKGEKFTTLDGENYITVGGEVVFKSPKGKIIDLPSIKGTLNTAVDDKTKNILFFMESINAEKVRFASMTHAIRTTAAQLMEKNADPHLGSQVLAKGAELYQKLCHAQTASQVHNEYPGKTQPRPVAISKNTIDAYLGVNLPIKKIIEILKDLKCQVSSDPSTSNSQNEKLIVTPPTFRPDITIPADIVEEIARIYGYHNLESVVMDTQIPLSKPKDVNFVLEEKIKRFLANIGWQELYTYSMVSQELATQSGFELNDHLKLQNPLTDDKVYLRRSLIPSLIEVIEQNSTVTNLSVFEMANVYCPQKNSLPKERMRLTLVSPSPYREVIGAVESLLDQLNIVGSKIVANKNDKSKAEITLSHEGQQIMLGEISLERNSLVAVDLKINN